MIPTFRETITVLNKLKAQDSPTKQDIWYKHVINDCSFTSKTTRTVQGDTVRIGNSLISRVPKNIMYKPYNSWIDTPTDGFTFSTGDIVIKGEITETEITSREVHRILQKYKPESFTINAFKDNTGIKNTGEHYRIEGV